MPVRRETMSAALRRGTPASTSSRTAASASLRVSPPTVASTAPKTSVTSPFGGSASQRILHALSTRKSSREELSQIRELLDRLEGGKR